MEKIHTMNDWKQNSQTNNELSPSRNKRWCMTRKKMAGPNLRTHNRPWGLMLGVEEEEKYQWSWTYDTYINTCPFMTPQCYSLCILTCFVCSTNLIHYLPNYGYWKNFSDIPRLSFHHTFSHWLSVLASSLSTPSSTVFSVTSRVLNVLQ